MFGNSTKIVSFVIIFSIIMTSFLLFIAPVKAQTENYRLINEWQGDLRFPFGIAVDKHGYVYVTDIETRLISKFTNSGSFVKQWGGDSQFQNITDICVDDNGNIFVLDGPTSVQKFTSDGIFVTKWGKWGNDNGQFDLASGISVDSLGNVFVAYFNSGIQKFSNEGIFLSSWIIDNPKSIAAEYHNCVYVLCNNGMIYNFTGDGWLHDQWPIMDDYTPWSIDVDSYGNIFTANPVTKLVQKYDNDGFLLTQWTTVFNPFDVAIDIEDNVFITDSRRPSVMTFSITDDLPNLMITSQSNSLLAINSEGNIELKLTFSDGSPISNDPVYLTSTPFGLSGTQVEKMTNSEGLATFPISSSITNVYTIMAHTDDVQSESWMLVVYDPSGGYITGGGWINSPEGAYLVDSSLAGKASFGFVAKYQKGAYVPSGSTEFQFIVADLNFHSASYKWLVVNQGGTNAQFFGDGTINGGVAPNGQNYKFMIWAGDHNPDSFRIKIWWEDDFGEKVVYDNSLQQAISGGSIVVHTK